VKKIHRATENNFPPPIYYIENKIDNELKISKIKYIYIYIYSIHKIKFLYTNHLLEFLLIFGREKPTTSVLLFIHLGGISKFCLS
jgi:hypothetical protein